MRYAVYRCLYGEDFVKQSIRSIAPYVDKIFVFWTDRVWGNVTYCTYKGERIEFPRHGFDQVMARVCEVAEEFPGKIVAQYDHVVNNRNQFTHLVNDLILPFHPKPDTIIVMEVDYVWRKDQIERALKEFAILSSMGVHHASSNQVELWKTFDYQAMRVDPNRRAAMFWDLSRIPQMFQTNRHADSAGMARLNAFVHNLGFCASSSVMNWKHLTAIGYAQRIGDSAPNESWYEEKWLRWDYETNNENLEMSKGYEHLIPHALPYIDPLPEVLL